MLECPDFFPLPSRNGPAAQVAGEPHVLRFSAEPCLDAYVVGVYNSDGMFQSNDTLARLSDGGRFCASRTLSAPSVGGDDMAARQILFGAVNCDSGVIYASASCNFCGVASAPRELWPDPADSTRLLVQPAVELTKGAPIQYDGAAPPSTSFGSRCARSQP